jgi:hypothetical protein
MGFAQVSSDLLNGCLGVAAPRPWSRFAKGIVTWEFPLMHASVFNSLRSKYSDRSLVRAGVAVQIDRRLVLSVPLSTGSRSILAMRAFPKAPPFDLLTSQGSLRGRLPIRSAIDDYKVRAAVEATGKIFVAFEFGDVIRLRSIGLATAPADGLENFIAKSAREFRYVFGASKQKPPAVPHSLVLVAWSPTQFSTFRPRLLDDVVRSLSDHAAGLGMPLHRIAVWSPSEAVLRDLSVCLRFGRRTELVAVITNSLEEESQPLANDPSEPDPRLDVFECERRLKQVLWSGKATTKRRRQALDAFRRAQTATFIRPLLASADEDDHPASRLRLRVVAEVAAETFFTAAMERLKLEATIAEHGFPNDAAATDYRGSVQRFEILRRLLEGDDK